MKMKKNLEWTLESLLKHLSEPGKTFLTKAYNLESDNEESASPQESQQKNNESLKTKMKNKPEFTFERLAKHSSEPGMTFLTKAYNLESDNEESAFPQESEKKNNENNEWLKTMKKNLELAFERLPKHLSEPRKTFLTKAYNLESGNEESASPQESRKKNNKNNEWLKTMKMKKNLEWTLERLPKHLSEPGKTFLTKAYNLEIHNEESVSPQECQKNKNQSKTFATTFQAKQNLVTAQEVESCYPSAISKMK